MNVSKADIAEEECRPEREEEWKSKTARSNYAILPLFLVNVQSFVVFFGDASFHRKQNGENLKEYRLDEK